jgi:hypothetical protein
MGLFLQKLLAALMSRHQLNALYLKKPILGFFKTFKNPYVCFGFQKAILRGVTQLHFLFTN